MQVYQGIEDFTRLEKAIVTTGTFDGVHLGHQKILNRLCSHAKEQNGESVLLTFWPHPRLVLDPDYDLKLLTTFDEKVELLRAAGVEHLIKIHFTEAFSNLTADEYIRKVLVEAIGTVKLIVGYDHRFGKGRHGDFEKLVKEGVVHGFEVEEIPKQELDDIAISSTRIRETLANGKIHEGNEYLGRPYMIEGEVIQGDRLGRTIGYPTANIKMLDSHKLVPCDGSYAVRVHLEGIAYDGMINIGFRPTLNGTTRSIEAHLFDFDNDIYGHILKVEFIRLIRREEKFESMEALRTQLEKDRASALDILANSTNT